MRKICINIYYPVINGDNDTIIENELLLTKIIFCGENETHITKIQKF